MNSSTPLTKRLFTFRLSTMIVVVSLVAVWLAIKFYREPMTTANLHEIETLTKIEKDVFEIEWSPDIMLSSGLCGAAIFTRDSLPSTADSRSILLSIKRVLSWSLLPIKEGTMLERYFQRPRVLRRIQKNPIREQIEQFVEYLDDRGHQRTTVHIYVQAVEHFGTWLGTLRRRRRLVNRETVDEFMERHLPGCSCPKPAPKDVTNTRAALRHLLRAVGECSSTNRRSSGNSPMNQLIEDYVEHLVTNCGLASWTCQYRARYAREFLEACFPKGRLKLDLLKPQHATQFVANYAQRCKRSTAQVAAGALRSFLRFLHQQGICDERLVRAVPSIPSWGLSSLPKTMSEAELHRFLDSFDRSTATGRRDYAMALSMIRLGLRVSEVSELKLQDVDWRNALVRIHSAKRRRSRELPLPQDIGSAIASYIQSGRPKSSCSGLFLRHTVPVGTSVTRHLVSCVIRRAYKRSGCSLKSTGTHILRHTAATCLHQHGASLKEIADLLGHRSIDTSMIYTKVDLPALSGVALPWPEELQS